MAEPPEGGPGSYCFEWGGEYWGKQYPGWEAFRTWLLDRGADPNAWIDAHPAAASCIGAQKSAPPPTPTPPPPVGASKAKCFDWGGESWGKDYPGWDAFYKWLVSKGDDPEKWIAEHPDAAKCIGATKKRFCFEWDKRFWGHDYPGWQAFEAYLTAHGASPDEWVVKHPDAARCIGAPAAPPPPPSPPPTPPPTPSPPGPQSTPSGASWNLDNGPWLFVESDPGSFRPGPWTRLDIQENAITEGAPLWSCDGGLVPQAEGGEETACRDWITANWNHSDSIAPVTTLGISASAFAELGVTSCMVECYLQGQANALDKYGEALREGWKDAIPVVGVGFSGSNGHFVLQDYANFLAQFGTRFAVYATDPMSDDDWSVLAKIVAGAPPAGGGGGGGGGQGPTGGGPGPGEGDTGGFTPTRTTPDGRHYCFKWGGEYWGGDYPGWGAFWQWLHDRGADPAAWVTAHNAAAYCIGALAVEPAAGAGATWENAFLAAGGWPDTLNNVQFMGDWQRFESGGSPHWPGDNNPFNMGTGPPGGQYESGSWHSSGVGATDIGIFPTVEAGAKGTAARIKGGRYPHIDAALKSGYGEDAQPSLIAEDLRVWGSTSFANYILSRHAAGGGGTTVPGPTKAPPPPPKPGKFHEPPATVAAWTELKRVFSRKAPSTRSSATAILDNPPSFLK